MKNLLKYTMALFLLAATTTLTSCSSDSDDNTAANELANLTKIQEFSNETHTIELFSEPGNLQQGFNDISLRIKENATGNYIKDATVSWQPVMHMTMMNHSCPKSAVTKVTTAGTLYNGYIVFQMAQNATEYWDLTIDYTIAGTAYSATAVIDVPASATRTVNSFMGADGARYIVAYIAPDTPKVAINDLTLGVWKMQDMMNFPLAEGFTVKIDPRMPGMGNHGSPNNVDATQKSSGSLYDGKLSLTMTGYWKINLQLQNPEGIILKGEAVTDTTTESSIFFELEF